MTFRGDPRSKIFSTFQSPYKPSFLTSIGTFDLQGSPEVKNIFIIWKPIYDFLFNSHRHFLSISYRFRDIRLQSFRVWSWPLTFRGHPRWKIFALFESSYMTSYLTPIDIFSLSRTVFEIFDFKGFRVWSWPLTFRGDPRSKIFSPFESPYMPFYLTSIGTFSLSRTVFEIIDSKVFRVWPWPLTFRGHLRSNIFSLFESPYMTSYLTSIDIFSLSRTVFEIFDFKIFRVWPWPLTFRGHLRSNIFSPFESPYMTSYLTSIDTFSLSRTVFEIFDFKVFRVWPWPLTFGVTLGQKYFHHWKVGWAAGLTYVFAKGVSDHVRDPLTPRNSLQ